MEKTPKVYSYSRYSSAAQGKGYSLERQIKRAREWCDERGYTLEETHFDEGLSGYHGDHISSGSLGRFLDDVKAGRVPTGSILLLEQLDRLTRQNLHVAQGIVWAILDAGIRIVTIADSQEYVRGQGLGGAVNLLVSLEASHKESDRKSDRMCHSWGERSRKATAGDIISKQCPGWLQVVNDKFELVPERVDLMHKIFSMASEGMGVQAIASDLNRQGIPTWKSGNPWLKASVYKLLVGRGVLGDLVMKLTEKGKDGRPDKKEVVTVPGYFPAIIDEATFYRVQKSLKERVLVSGKRGAYRNLFSEVSVCGYCGSRMTIFDAGKKGGGQFRHKIVCNKARLGHGCNYFSAQYQPLEDAILDFCNEVDYSSLLSTGEDKELSKAKERIKELTDRLIGKEAQIENELSLSAMATTTSLKERLFLRIDAIQNEIDSLNNDIADCQREVDRLSRSGSTLVDHVETIRKLRAMLGDESLQLEARRKIRYAMTEALDSIAVFANGLNDKVVAWDPSTGLTVIPCYRDHAINQELERSMLAEHVAADTGRDAAVVLLRFKNGHSRLLGWLPDEQRFILVDEATKNSVIINGIDFFNTPGSIGLLVDATPKGRGFKDSDKLPLE